MFMLNKKMKAKANSRPRGFTLLEILIALFIFTIVAVIMTRALHTVLNSQDATEKHAARLTELQIATLLLSLDLEQTIDRPVINAKGTLEPSFSGDHSHIVFTHGGLADPTGQAQRSTLQRTAYFIENKNFIRQVWPVLDQVQTTKPLRRNLLTSVHQGYFEFLDDKNVFHNSWPPSEQTKSQPPPRAVRITLTLTDWGKITQTYVIAGQTSAPPKP